MIRDKLELGDLEVDILKMCNQDKAFLIRMVKYLDKNFLESSTLQKIFLIYKVFFEKKGKAPTKTIIEKEMEKLEIKPERYEAILGRIFDASPIDPAEKDYITDEVIRLSKQKRMERAIIKSSDVLDAGDLDDEKFNEILTNVKDALQFSIDTNLGVDLYDIDERYRRILESQHERISTGYAQIDKVLGGGVSKKEEYAFQSPPGTGKCSVYDTEIEVEIDTDDPLYQKLKHLLE